MSQTALMAADLLAKVRSITALALRTSLTLGGRTIDPGLVNVALPAAWVTHTASKPDQRDYTHGPESGFISASMQMAEWAVILFIEYSTDDDMLNVQYPLLDELVLAVHGTLSPTGMQWRDAGRRISKIYPDRLAYEQNFTLSFIHQ